MWCTSCARSVGDAVAKVQGVRSADVNYASKLLVVESGGERAAVDLEEEILSKVDRIGFAIKPLPEGWTHGFRETLEEEMDGRLSWASVAIVWFLAMWSSMLAFARYAGAGLSETEAFYLSAASSAFGLPAILIGLRPYALAGVRALFSNRRLTLDLFIFLGAVAAIFVSVLSFFKGQAVSYADSGAMIIAILLLTKKIENAVVKKVTSSILSQLQTGQKNVEVLKSGAWTSGDLSQIRRGDRVRFKAQDTISFDGSLALASASVNAHLLSGENVPCALVEGDDLFAGAIALSDVEMIVQKPLGFRRIDAWAETALASQARGSNFSKVFSKIEANLTGVALTGAFSLGVLAVVRGADFAEAARSFFIGILIFCPCLFASIVPLTKQIAHLALLRLGVLVTRSEALLDLNRVETLCFDKTGTLEAVATTFEAFGGRDEVMPYLSEIARRSAHPLLRSLGRESSGMGLASFEEIAGEGVCAITENGDRILIGRASYLKRNGVASDERWDEDFPGVVWNGQVVGQILVKKTYDSKSKELLLRLLERNPKLKIEILSGDPVSGAGDELNGLDARIRYRGGLSPDEKAALVGAKSAFVGDGLNDTLALAKADVSFRIGPRAAGFAPVDFHLQVPRLGLVFDVMAYARRYRRILLQTAAAALIYNLCAFTLAALGAFSPLGAVVAMLVSFSVLLLSSLRLLKSGRSKFKEGLCG
jgi:cation transport ATPase